MSTSTAKRCFDENIRLFCEPSTDPEKFNLYSGLSALSDTMAALEREVKSVQDDLRQLKDRR